LVGKIALSLGFAFDLGLIAKREEAHLHVWNMLSPPVCIGLIVCPAFAAFNLSSFDAPFS
jgi:hypothetical protein